MKLKFLLLFSLIIVSITLSAQAISQFRQGDSIVAGMGCSRGFSVEYHFKPKDINSYQHLKNDFGKDIFQVYFQGKALANINPDKAEIIYAKDRISKEAWYRYNNLFLTDGNITYYDDVQMQCVDPQNIFYITDNRIPLFRSNNNVYFKGFLLDKLNADKTTVIDSHPNEKINFFTDGKFIYQNEKLIKNADIQSFDRNHYVNSAD